MVLGIVTRNSELLSSVQVLQIVLGLSASAVSLPAAEATLDLVTPHFTASAANPTIHVELGEEHDEQNYEADDLTSAHVPLNVNIFVVALQNW